MPRTGRGGMREGKPGQAYSNRTDLNKAEPVTTVPGQGYGVAAQQRAAQRAIPMSSQPVSVAPQSAPNAALAAQPQMPAPAPQNAAQGPEVPDLFRPSERPAEPITAGVDFGPGADSSHMVGSADNNVHAARVVYEMANSQYATPEILDLARYALAMYG